MGLAESFEAAGWGYKAPCFVSALGLFLQELSLEPQALGPSQVWDGGRCSISVACGGHPWRSLAQSWLTTAVEVEGLSELGMCGFMVEPHGCSWLFSLLPPLCDVGWGHAVACHRCVRSWVPASVPRVLGTSVKATQSV